MLAALEPITNRELGLAMIAVHDGAAPLLSGERGHAELTRRLDALMSGRPEPPKGMAPADVLRSDWFKRKQTAHDIGARVLAAREPHDQE